MLSSKGSSTMNALEEGGHDQVVMYFFWSQVFVQATLPAWAHN